MSQLDQDIRAAIALGISYGRYKARTYDPSVLMVPPAKKKRKCPDRRFTDEQAFALWQAGKSDTEIGSIVGVSRQTINKWRDVLELPSTTKKIVNTQKYRLCKLKDGTYIVVHTDEI